MNTLEKFSTELVEILNERELDLLNGGSVISASINNGDGSCTGINNGNGTCSDINNGDGKCSGDINNGNGLCQYVPIIVIEC
ncbi:hypothetical protein PGIN_YH522_01137 [Porphyromonas gingivalis]|uniref:hypothetical protein n=1 Tax=Porphyromonas gingivalis TaxID=837 RepID=UPI000974FC53|nr:hypothetical protein [Porphyromonas gingivalis]SJL31093.1 hypothetical protein PGIN_YH522_01137 [Porphyromonas gingivalis]